MKNFGKPLKIFILARIIDLIYAPPLFTVRHLRSRRRAISHFVEENKLSLRKPLPNIVRQSVDYYRMFKKLNMFLLLAGVYIKDIGIF